MYLVNLEWGVFSVTFDTSLCIYIYTRSCPSTSSRHVRISSRVRRWVRTSVSRIGPAVLQLEINGAPKLVRRGPSELLGAPELGVLRVRLLHDVHVAQQTLNGDVAYRLAEEQPLHGGLTDWSQAGDHQQQSAEPRWLTRMFSSYVVVEDALRLILEHLYWLYVDQTWSLCKISR